MEMEMGIQAYLIERYVQAQLQSGETTKHEGEMMIDWIVAYGSDLRKVFFENGIFDPAVIESELYNLHGQTH